MQIERGTLNTLLVNARPTLSPSRWLLWFRDPERNASVYCLCSALVAGSPTLIRFEETDTPTALNGQVKLSPPGNWTLKIYEQSSTTNLNPANATRLVEERAVFVVGAVEPESGWSGTECPPGSGDCDPTTVNGTESDVRDISVRRGGVEVGTLAPSTGMHTVPECEPCPPGDDVTIRTTDGITVIDTVPAGTNYDLPSTVLSYEEWDGAPAIYVTLFDTLTEETEIRPDVAIPRRELFNADDEPLGLYVTLANLLNDTVPQVPACSPCEDVTIQLRDSAGNNIGAPDVYPDGTTTTKTAPDGSVQLQDSAGANIGSPVSVRSNQTGLTVTAPDGSVTIQNSVPTTLHTVAVRSNGTATQAIADSTAVIKNLNGTTIKTEAIPAAASENITAPIPLKFGWGAGDADTLTWTVTDDEAGTYGTYTQDGGSGTITYSKNGGGFVAVSGAISLAVADTIVVRRTTTTNQGFSRWVP